MTGSPQTVTMEQIEALVVSTEYTRPKTAQTLTICVLRLKNGFTVTGESACADPALFDKDLGEKYAREAAIEKIWPLEGYLLRQKLAEAEAEAKDAPVAQAMSEAAKAYAHAGSEYAPRAQHRENIMQFFAWDHLPVRQADLCRPFSDLAEAMVETLPQCPERSVALRKLLESRDSALRALTGGM